MTTSPDTPVPIVPTHVLLLAEDPVAMRALACTWSELHPEPGRPGLIVMHRGQPSPALPSSATQLALGARGWFDGERFSTPGRRLVEALTTHDAARARLASVAMIVAPDALVGAVTSQLSGATTHAIAVEPWSRFAEATHRAYLISLLDAAPGRGNRLPASAALIREALDLPDPTGEILSAVARALSVLQGQGGFAEIADLAPVLTAAIPEGRRRALGIDVVLRSSAISLGAPSEPGDGQIAAATFAAADTARREGRGTEAVRLLTAGLRLLFNGELHTDSEWSPLVADPVTWLAPWRESAFAAYVAEAMRSRRVTLTESAVAQEGSSIEPTAYAQRVVVLRGAYGNFAGPVIDVLHEAGAPVEVIDPAAIGPLLTRHNVVEPLVAEWLRRLDPPQWETLPGDDSASAQIGQLAAAIHGADVIFADWCDPSAVFASLTVPSSTRLVVRVHRVDAVRVWQQFVDWAAVDELIFVADHVRDLVAAQISTPGQEPPTRVHVLNNVIDVQRYRRPKSVGAHRRIALVGWGRRVKDPLFALDILEELLREDPTWQLHLIGRDFGPPASGPAGAYAARFRQRATSEPLRAAIRWVGFTHRLEAALDECGFALSTSRIEGWPVGVVEAAASGAIPVIREWTQLPAGDAAARIYADTPDWVIDSPAAAAARIRRFADPQAWALESQRVRAAAEDLCRVGDTASRYPSVILGK